MGTIMTADDVKRINQVAPTIPAVIPGAPQSEVAATKNFLKDLGEIVKDVKGMVEIVAQSRGITKAPPGSDVIVSREGEKTMSPSQMQSFKGQPTGNAPVQDVQVEYREVIKPVDPVMIERLLYDLVVVQAEKLPEEWKEKKLGDMLGANFKNVTYLPKELEGIVDKPLSSDQLVKIISKNAAELIDKYNRGEIHIAPAVVPTENQ